MVVKKLQTISEINLCVLQINATQGFASLCLLRVTQLTVVNSQMLNISAGFFFRPVGPPREQKPCLPRPVKGLDVGLQKINFQHYHKLTQCINYTGKFMHFYGDGILHENVVLIGVSLSEPHMNGL